MNIRCLECFIAAAEELNFTRAAERLYLSQQSLSYQVQKLEEEYHTTFFERSPSLRLTLAGQDMVFYAKQVLNLDAQMRANFADISAFCRGQIRLGIARLRSTTVFPMIYNEFHKKWKNIDFKLVDGSSSRFGHMIANQELDVYVGFSPLDNADFRSVKIGMDQLVCCINPTFFDKYAQVLFSPEEHKAANYHAVRIKDACRFPLCLLPGNSVLRTKLDQYLIANRIKPNIIFESAGQDTMLQLCQDNPVLGILTNTAFCHYIDFHNRDATSLIAFPVQEDIASFPIYLVYRKNAALPQYFQDFIAITAATFQKHSLRMQETLLRSGRALLDCGEAEKDL